MVSRDAVLDVLRSIDDPEMPISIVDLGLVAEVEAGAGGEVGIALLPTFVGCHALPVIEELVRRRVGTLPGVTAVRVCHQFEPPWTVDRISAAGRERLRSLGITVPTPEADEPTCPFCGSARVQRESPFGPTRCKMIYHCLACRNPFEHLKRLPPAALLQLGTPDPEARRQ